MGFLRGNELRKERVRTRSCLWLVFVLAHNFTPCAALMLLARRVVGCEQQQRLSFDRRFLSQRVCPTQAATIGPLENPLTSHGRERTDIIGVVVPPFSVIITATA